MFPIIIATAAIVSTLLIFVFWVPIAESFDYDLTDELSTTGSLMEMSASELQTRFQQEYIHEMLSKSKSQELDSPLETVLH